MKKNSKMLITTRTLVFAALFAALAAVLGQLLAFRPMEHMKFTLDKFILFLSGMFFGPLVGAMTGFVAEFAGGNLLGRGFTIWLCVPAVLYGLCGGLFRPMIRRSGSLVQIALAFLPAVVLGSILYQSFALTWIYGGDAKKTYLMTKLVWRGIQFAITYVVDVLIIYGLCRSNLFRMIGFWTKEGEKS